MDLFNKEFKAAVKKINLKLKEAQASLEEASLLAKEAGLTGLINSQWNEMPNLDKICTKEYIDSEPPEYELKEEIYELIKVRPFETALNDCGWSASSSYC